MPDKIQPDQDTPREARIRAALNDLTQRNNAEIRDQLRTVQTLKGDAKLIGTILLFGVLSDVLSVTPPEINTTPTTGE